MRSHDGQNYSNKWLASKILKGQLTTFMQCLLRLKGKIDQSASLNLLSEKSKYQLEPGRDLKPNVTGKLFIMFHKKTFNSLGSRIHTAKFQK